MDFGRNFVRRKKTSFSKLRRGEKEASWARGDSPR